MKTESSIPLPNPAAFPLVIPTDTPWHYEMGMTLRDYFAGQLIVQAVAMRLADLDGRACYDLQEVPDLAARDAYMIADAMLAARKEGRPPTASYPPAPVSNLGDAVADMFDQLVKGNWIDDHGHPVANNAAMIRLKERLESLMGYIAAARGKEGE